MGSLRAFARTLRWLAASAAIGGSYVHTGMGSVSLPYFPPAVPCSGAPFPPQGPLGGVPLLHGYIEALRLPDDPPTWLRFLRQRGTTATRVRSLREAGAHLPRAWAGIRLPTGLLTWSRLGLPRFLGHPRVCVPRSLTPARSLGLAVFRPGDAAFRYRYSVGSRDKLALSWLYHAARTLTVYASQPGLPRHHARLVSGWGPPLPGGG